MKKLLSLIFPFLFFTTIFAQPMPGSLQELWEETKDKPVTRNPYTLIIYRPQNNGTLNDIRCFLKLEDENGNDVTYTACTATYEWVTENMWPNPGVTDFASVFKKDTRQYINYKKTYFLSGAMAMHLVLKPGKYKISLYTPVDQQNNFVYPAEEKPFEWKSNIFEYDTANPTNVLFVKPTTNDNGFYNGGWKIDFIYAEFPFPQEKNKF